MRLFKRIILIISIPIIIGLMNFAVDPLQFYHQNTVFEPAFSEDMRYQAAGLIKNFDYDTIILGTTASSNFSLKELLDDYKISAIRLTLDNASVYEQKKLMEFAIKRGSVRRVIWEMDYFALSLPSGYITLPNYLYDNNPFNDYNYLLNPMITLKSFGIIREHKLYDAEDAYNALNNLATSHKTVASDMAKTDDIGKNIDYILGFALDNSNVEFLCYFPPILSEGFSASERQLEMRDYIYSHYSKGYNIKIYDFSAMEEKLSSSEILHWVLTKNAITRGEFETNQEILFVNATGKLP